MSVVHLACQAKRQVPRSDGESSPAGATADAKTVKVAQAIEAVAQFIPTEVVGFYVTASALLAPMALWESWAVIVGSLFLIPILFWLGGKVPAAMNAGAVKKGVVSKLVAASSVSFLAWASAMPGSPVAMTWGAAGTRTAALIVIVLALLLPLWARKIGIVET